MAKRAQLVSQHLENISSDALEKYQDVIRNYVRRRQGGGFLFMFYVSAIALHDDAKEVLIQRTAIGSFLLWMLARLPVSLRKLSGSLGLSPASNNKALTRRDHWG